ncbi:diacylglycerol kinase family protein [Qipengyuania sp. XHP0207]|uniref:diacylglycerol/lipid kinase family protein n=1 Tax=Qipengyuania sp. XHP0207 TaxID=3038078 RepID=UPI0024202670|nr:diacylglycerol kinase family protein [Qipengyuania sp. XHP0207]MDG5747991.1 diacylglycerol kinase family protein [Qipengyuania sp. XHP0207]
MNQSIYRSDRLPRKAAPHAPMQGDAADAPGGGGAGPRIGVIYNPRSHRNKGQDLDCTDRPGISVAQPRTREDIAGALADFAAQGIDYLIINGGDGTVRDVLTMGQSVFGDRWPALAILPKGKTNALNVDLGAPAGWNLPGAIAAYSGGKRIVRHPLSVAPEGAPGLPMLGFIFGAGAFTLGIEAGQDAHELGFFNSLAVGATGAWGVLQSLFGSQHNKWRRGTQMALTAHPSGVPIPRSAHGDPARRNILLATSLHRLPMDLKIFGPEEGPVRLAVLDKSRRRVMAALPAILLGWRPRWMASAGYHQMACEGFRLDVADPVILDGEAFPAGTYTVTQGPALTFVTP